MRLEQIPYGSPLYEEACRLRDSVLRIPIGLRLSETDTVGEETQLHAVARDDEGTIVGTVILKPLTAQHMKLRQMAVSQAVQGQGVGAKLVHFAEALARHHFFTSMECNARVYAVGFYQKLGYRTEGEEFIEVGLPTIRMTKLL
jgi:predicted GNAT family N-acyltransferase